LSGGRCLAVALVFVLAAPGCRGGRPGNPGEGTTNVTCKPEGITYLEEHPEPSRRVLCAIDVGSRNVKLIVSSVASGDPLSFRNERQCRARLQLADRTTDKKTGEPKPLAEADEAALVSVFEEYKERCKQDGGKVIRAIATEWARKIPNADELQRSIERQTSLTLEILGRQEEARFGYLAATRGERGKLVLDFGSRSLQLSFWAKSSPNPVVVGIPFGIDEAGDRFFGGPAVTAYGAGQRALAQALRAELEPFFAKVREARGRGDVGGQLFSLGENGDLALALKGMLWEGATPRAISEANYSKVVRTFAPTKDPARGLVAGVFTPQELAEPTRFLEQNPTLFEDLRSTRLKRVFGNKMLVFPALIALLEAELDLDEVVLVPQEMSDGVLLERLDDKTTARAPARGRGGWL
jgi:Ppx/GppA phosphatase family